MTKLARAAAHLSAVRIGRAKWAYYADETRCWYAVTSDDLRSLCAYLDDETSGGYSRWCADTTAEEIADPRA